MKSLVPCLVLLLFLSCSEPSPYGCYADLALENGKGDVSGRYFMHETSIRVGLDDGLEITASGEVCWDYEDNCSGPDPQGPYWGLYARIGEEGIPFSVGRSYSVNAARDSGTLYLMVPEGEDPYTCFEDVHADNYGHFFVTVTVTTAQ